MSNNDEAVRAKKYGWWWTDTAALKRYPHDWLRAAWFYEAEKRLLDIARRRRADTNYRYGKSFPKLSEDDKARIYFDWDGEEGAFFQGHFGPIVGTNKERDNGEELFGIAITVDLREGNRAIANELGKMLDAERKRREIELPKAGRRRAGQHGGIPWRDIQWCDRMLCNDKPKLAHFGSHRDAEGALASAEASMRNGRRRMEERYFQRTSYHHLPQLLRVGRTPPPVTKVDLGDGWI